MSERGLAVVPTTVYRWVQANAPEIDERCRPYLKPTNDSWRVDETYVKVRGQWMYLYRALDSAGNTLDFLLYATRSRRAAKRFLREVLAGNHVTAPRVINVDKNPTYIGAVRDLKREKLLTEGCKRRPNQYMNHLIEQDHRFIKRRVKAGLGFFSYPTAWRTIRGYEAMHMIRKGQVREQTRETSARRISLLPGCLG
jgi:transposase, IS6 family